MRQATLGLGLVLALAGTAGAQPAAAGAAASAPAAVAAPEPKPEDTNAQRAKSQPGNNAPFWRAVRESGQQEGYTSLPGAEKGTLIQSFVQYPGSRLTNAGEAWRQVRNQWIIPYGGSLLLIAVLALAIFYKTKGPLGGHQADTGRKIERFTPFERAAHWANAGAFVALAVSGIVMAFGKFFLLPVIGSTLFGWLSFLLKNLHNFVGPLFAVSLLIVIVTFIKDNIANAADFVWLKRAGGMLGGSGEVPSHRFNAGEKGMFWWGVTVPGIVIVASGLVLDKLVPGFGELRGEMQIAHMVHAVAAMIMMTALVGHIYMGTIGVKGALGAMKTGWVDEGWAKEHHELWYDDVKAGKIPAQRSGQPAPGGVAGPVARA
ncbi:formate dehydrogenase subunit gamma [Aquabacterium sp. OR-4]|uniref:formate dehydrogenase subunit gamma n=1 Tax=Aquabacterium sp. OR-4 TaxID=2978127 RepID=UPI0021B403C6|nr:formate dehydrogenase subunit gamma [Aquabacterium sp. OR-4]MDT7838686.1 formate dehydrogenase subunit gamma [Aquabacterium sp. OR-4]